MNSSSDLLRATPARASAPMAGIDLEYFINAIMALAIIIFLLPILVATALAVRLHDGGPVLFGHPRIGRGGRTFRCLKFRSMAVDANAQLKELLAADPVARREWERDHKLKVDPRITPLGDFLRRSSLDELPQLFNVVRGEMNLVGPRPVVQAEVARYGHRFYSYCSVSPGISGLWQVSGRSDTTYSRRVALDVLYARNKSAILDAKILFATIPAVLLRKGSY